MSTHIDVEKLLAVIGAGVVRRNYIVPGLTSTAIARPDGGGMIRVFDMTRDQELDVTPHDHRYDFQCFVVRGAVTHRRYRVYDVADRQGATWAALAYDPATRTVSQTPRWMRGLVDVETYPVGDWYGCAADEFHSVRFERHSRVLFLEGPQKKTGSSVIVPVVDGEVCDTFMSRDWMMT